MRHLGLRDWELREAGDELERLGPLSRAAAAPPRRALPAEHLPSDSAARGGARRHAPERARWRRAVRDLALAKPRRRAGPAQAPGAARSTEARVRGVAGRAATAWRETAPIPAPRARLAAAGGRRARRRGWPPPRARSSLARGRAGSTGSRAGARCAPRSGVSRSSPPTPAPSSSIPCSIPASWRRSPGAGGRLGFGDRTRSHARALRRSAARGRALAADEGALQRGALGRAARAPSPKAGADPAWTTSWWTRSR